ncbi:hypothetical protein [Candidatus Borreliella tachyglossi]|nr:hypothetical protein [Candidatus Borreliella tachyglossi]
MNVNKLFKRSSRYEQIKNGYKEKDEQIKNGYNENLYPRREHEY